jgi:hypothetical protein
MSLIAALLLLAPGERELNAAIELYRSGEFEKALGALEAVARSSQDPKIRGRARLSKGQCFAALQRFDKIDAEFTRALEDDPELQLDPSRVQPAIVSMLDAARARLHGELDVLADAVTLDDRPLGRGRQQTGIGRHRLGVGDERRDIVLHANEVMRVDAAPAPAPPAPAAAAPAAPPAAVEAHSSLAVLIELRATADPRDWSGPVRGAPAPELSIGASGRNWSITGGAMLGGAWGATLRAAGRLPELLGPLGVELGIHGNVLFSAPVAGGLAALVGPTLALGRWLELFAGVGGGFLAGSPAFRNDYLLLTLALRARIST